jgi:hypothetical protein
MKRMLLVGIFGVLVLMGALLLFSKPTVMKTTARVRADEGGRCSLATVAGNYGFTLTGTLVLTTGGVPVAGAGLATISSEGNFSGTESRSLGGGIAQETIGGTVAVNSDCTGTLTAPVFESGNLVRTSIFSLVFDDNARELRAIQTSLVLPNGTSVPNVITVDGRKISPPKVE